MRKWVAIWNEPLLARSLQGSHWKDRPDLPFRFPFAIFPLRLFSVASMHDIHHQYLTYSSFDSFTDILRPSNSLPSNAFLHRRASSAEEYRIITVFCCSSIAKPVIWPYSEHCSSASSRISCIYSTFNTKTCRTNGDHAHVFQRTCCRAWPQHDWDPLPSHSFHQQEFRSAYLAVALPHAFLSTPSGRCLLRLPIHWTTSNPSHSKKY